MGKKYLKAALVGKTSTKSRYPVLLIHLKFCHGNNLPRFLCELFNYYLNSEIIEHLIQLQLYHANFLLARAFFGRCLTLHSKNDYVCRYILQSDTESEAEGPVMVDLSRVTKEEIYAVVQRSKQKVERYKNKYNEVSISGSLLCFLIPKRFMGI